MSGRLRVGLLGQVEVTVDGAPAPITGTKAAVILAALALNAPHPVSAERLIDAVWESDPPAKSANALQALISSLRRALGRTSIERRGSGYVLDAGPEDVDAIQLEHLVRAGREAAGADPASAATRYAAAIALVRGPILGDLAGHRFGRDAVVRLDELVCSAHEGLIDIRLDRGEHASLVTELTTLVQAMPYHERFHAQLIITLYRCGRQADALQAYQQVRRMLADDLGVEPGPELRALEAAVLNHDRSLRPPPPERPGATALGATPREAAVPDRLPLVGRTTALTELDDDFAAVRSGQGRIVLVGGEPGIGKTRLVEEFVARATGDGALAAWGRSYDGRGAPAFWPWSQAMAALLDQLGDEAVARALGDSAAELAQVLPAVKEVVPDLEPPALLDPESARFRLFQAFGAVLRRLAGRQPVVVALDDLHWADPSSLELLAFLSREIDDAAIAVVGTFRNIDPALGGEFADTLVQMSGRPAVRTRELRGLDAAGVDALSVAAGSVLDEPGLRDLLLRTDGNPFFVIELMRDAAASRGTVPTSVKGVVRRRLGRLPERTTRTLAVAAALGQAFDLAVLAACLQVDGASLLEHLEPAMDAGLVVDNVGGTSRYRFSHGLVNETIYEDMGSARRARVHLAIAEALEVHHGDSMGPHVLATAGHWFNAVPAASPARFVEHALRAAVWASEHVAHRQAIEQLHAAVELIAAMPEGRDRSLLELRVQDQLSGLLIASTSYTDADFERVCDRVRQLSLEVDDETYLIPALWRLALHRWMRSEIDAGAALGRQLLALPSAAEPGPAQIAGHLVIGLIEHEIGHQPAARRHLLLAESMCNRVHDLSLTRNPTESPKAMSRMFAAFTGWLLGNEEEADRDALDTFYFEAGLSMHSWATALSVWCAATISMLRGDAEETLRRSDDALALAVAGGYGLAVPYVMVCRGWAIASLGDPVAGEAELVRGTEIAESFGAEYMRALFRIRRAEICLMAGRPGDALSVTDEGLAIVASNGDRSYEADLYRVRGEAMAQLDRADEAIEHVERAVEIAAAQGALALQRRAEATLARLTNDRSAH